ncbi:MAG: DnaD domain protein [Erysipelotrichia bacterium]|jgi:replication initiation and membrane attachment protein DnaB|nr:DnaD domain protein [Erysipelotrichia bacterium]
MKKWIIHHPITLSTQDLNALQLAYSLIVTPQTVSMYMLCCAFSTIREGSFTSHDLAIHLNVFDHEVEPLLQSCVSVGLCEWYEQNNVITLVLKAPLSITQLTDHPLFGRLLSTQESLYLKALMMKYPPLSQNLTPTSFKYNQRQLSWDESQEQNFQKQTIQSSTQDSFFKPNLFLNLCTDIIFPMVFRTPEIMQTIENIANTYLVDEASMRKYVSKVINYDKQTINLDKLLQNVKTMHQVSGYTNLSYQQHHLSFFTALNEGRPIIQKDQQLIEYLKEKYTFDQETFNFLLETILKSSQGRFTRKYAEQIGESWVRAKVKNIEDAKRYVTSQTSVTSSKVVQLPDYYDQVDDSHDKENLLKQLKEMDDE